MGISHNKVRLAIPSKGALEKSTLSLLAGIGLKVHRPNDRQYIASIPSVPEIEVLFQRAADIFAKVHEGSADLGITGYDVVAEEEYGDGKVIIAYDKLGFGSCDLVLAVPNSWIDISNMEDLAELTLLWKEKNQPLRIVTKYKNLTKRWLFDRKITNFVLVDAKGALEAAPSMGYADMIADVTSTGTTLRENSLKPIAGGKMLRSQACLIANRKSLKSDDHLRVTQLILELIEANQAATKYTSITANVYGKSMEEVGDSLTREASFHNLAGLRGPTIAPVYSNLNTSDCRDRAENWYAITIVVRQEHFMEAVQHLRRAGGTDITVFPPTYIFGTSSQKVEELMERLA
jgi:ATP phosphoribosyltransferase